MTELAQVFAGSAEVAAFEAFVLSEGPLSIPEVKRITDIPHMTAYRIVERMAESGVLSPYDRQGRAIRYVLNGDNPSVEIFAKAFRLAMLEQVKADAATQAPGLTDDVVVPDLVVKDLNPAPYTDAQITLGVVEAKPRPL